MKQISYKGFSVFSFEFFYNEQGFVLMEVHFNVLLSCMNIKRKVQMKCYIKVILVVHTLSFLIATNIKIHEYNQS